MGAVLVGGYRVNEYFTKDMEKHPLTSFIDSYQKYFDGYKMYQQDAESIPIRQQIANDQLIFQSKDKVRPMKRVSFPDSFSRASDFLIPVGSQVDLSDLNIKYSWQENDDIFGVPYPHKE